MGRKIVPVDLHEGGDTMLTSDRSVIKFYEALIERSKKYKGKWTTYGFKIEDKFIKGLESRLKELQEWLA